MITLKFEGMEGAVSGFAGSRPAAASSEKAASEAKNSSDSVVISSLARARYDALNQAKVSQIFGYTSGRTPAYVPTMKDMVPPEKLSSTPLNAYKGTVSMLDGRVPKALRSPDIDITVGGPNGAKNLDGSRFFKKEETSAARNGTIPQAIPPRAAKAFQANSSSSLLSAQSTFQAARKKFDLGGENTFGARSLAASGRPEEGGFLPARKPVGEDRDADAGGVLLGGSEKSSKKSAEDRLTQSAEKRPKTASSSFTALG